MAGINSDIAVIDIEASGLGPDCYPIELGWTLPDTGRSGSQLIRPAASWYTAPWDPAAEQIHGISREMLEEHGLRPASALSTFLEAVAGRRWLLSDGLASDRAWMEALFTAASRRGYRINMLGQGVGPGFKLIDLDQVLLGYASPRQLGKLRARWRAERGPAAHRAEPDARALADLLRRVQRGR